jgi:hypothetical protein
MIMKAKTAKEVLIAAKWILKNVGWTKGSWYRDAGGIPVSGNHAKIASCCLDGAMDLVECTISAKMEAFLRLKSVTDGNILGFNDDPLTTKKMVLDKLDEAIKLRS